MLLIILMVFVLADPMISLTAASYTLGEGDGSSMVVCAQLDNVLSPSGIMTSISVNLLLASGTASTSSEMPSVAMHSHTH